MYQKIIAFAKTECTPILELSGHVFKGTNRDILVDCVWATVATGIMENQSAIFAVGLPDVFQKVLTISETFAVSIKVEVHS